MTFTANGKRQTADSRLRFLRINTKYTRILQNNSGVHDQRETTCFQLEKANSKWQTRRKHGHAVTSALCRKSDAKSL